MTRSAISFCQTQAPDPSASDENDERLMVSSDVRYRGESGSGNEWHARESAEHPRLSLARPLAADRRSATRVGAISYGDEAQSCAPKPNHAAHRTGGPSDLQDRKPQSHSCRNCLAFQALQQAATKPSILVGGQKLEPFNKPMIRVPFDSNDSDISSIEVDDHVVLKIHVGAAVQCSPGLFCIHAHARFRHPKRKRRIFTCRLPKGKIVHSIRPLNRPGSCLGSRRCCRVARRNFTSGRFQNHA